MQLETKQIDPLEEKPNSGVLGRMTDSLSQRGHNTASFSVSGFSQAILGEPGVTAGQVIVDRNGVSSPEVSESFLAHIGNLQNMTFADSGFFADTWSENLMDSISASEIFGELLDGANGGETNTPFPDSSLGRELALITRLMATAGDRGVDTDTFYVSMGGVSILITNQVYSLPRSSSH